MRSRSPSAAAPSPDRATGRHRRWLLLLLAGTVLAGCGVKGRLRHPKESEGQPKTSERQPEAADERDDEIERIEEFP